MRIAIVFGAAILIWRLVHRAGDAIFGQDYDRGRHVASAVAVSVLAVATVVLASRHLDRLPRGGLRRPSPVPLLVGAAGYLIPAGLAVAGCLAMSWLDIDSDGSLIATVPALIVLVLLYEALPEELIFRGYLYRNLAAALPAWGAVIVQAVLFTLFGMAVGAAGSAGRIVLLFGFAVVQGAIRAVTGTVGAAVGFHLAFQTAEQIVGPSWHGFTVDDLGLLQQVALGLVPLAVGVPVVRLLWRRVAGLPRRVG